MAKDYGRSDVHDVGFPVFNRRRTDTDGSKSRLLDMERSPESTYEEIDGQLGREASAAKNLATFSTTIMEPEARRLMAETLDRNLVTRNQYPEVARIEGRCLEILADLWHAPTARTSDPIVGTSTAGSSEAAMLGGLAMKAAWQKKRNPTGGVRPNLVMGINAHVCWAKFGRYWDVEIRYVPLDGKRLHLGAAEAVALCDENTIGVVGILGSTYDGSYEPIEALALSLDDYESATGLDIPIHVDAASGGFVAPFLSPNLRWDFELDRVVSINVSGHKFGLVYPGVGWVLWRDRTALPEELVFYSNYLGRLEPSMAINFTRPGSQVVAQYYQFLRLGRSGYRRIHSECRQVASMVADELAATGAFEIITRGSDVPLVAFKLIDGLNFDEFDLSAQYRKTGWQVPAYNYPDNRSDLSVMRVVCRQGFDPARAMDFIADTKFHLSELSSTSVEHRV